MKVWGTPILGEVAPVLILRCGRKASTLQAPRTCILSKGIAYVAHLECGCLKGCRFCITNFELSIERIAVVVFNCDENDARYQGNTESERHRVTAGDTSRIRQKAFGSTRAGQ